MPIKPTRQEIKAEEIMRKNPNFGKEALEAIINEMPDLCKDLLKKGLVEVVED